MDLLYNYFSLINKLKQFFNLNDPVKEGKVKVKLIFNPLSAQYMVVYILNHKVQLHFALVLDVSSADLAHMYIRIL